MLSSLQALFFGVALSDEKKFSSSDSRLLHLYSIETYQQYLACLKDILLGWTKCPYNGYISFSFFVIQ